MEMMRRKRCNYRMAVCVKDDVSIYVLKLYISGVTPRSAMAVRNVKKICEEHLTGRYELEVIDIYQQPVLAKGEQIIVAPTLLKKHPLPLKRFIGDMTDTDGILLGLDLRRKTEKEVERNRN
jgi:circadian clock protein KaiB